jgi:tetratricopeptide (TPR) repeat protein
MKRILQTILLPPAFLIVLLLMNGCSSEKNTLVSTAYHDVTSAFNALFIAEQIMAEVEQDIQESQIYNYDEISSVFPPIDSVTVAPYSEQLDKIIEKAGLIIQFHGNSHYVDDAYYVIGKARYYKMQLMEANETLRFVNVKSEDVDLRHRALIFLMRVYMADNKMSEAEEVADFLKREEMIAPNLASFYLSQAAFYQKRGDLDNMVPNLAQAAPLLKDKRELPRINFMLAQVYQQLGFDAGAYEAYRQVWKNSRDYRQSLYARLFMQQVAQLNKGSDLDKARKFYQSMLKEGKNEEFQDRIYLEMGAFEQRNGYEELAMQYYKEAIGLAENNRNRALAYLAAGTLHFDRNEYLPAKLYYDSVMLDLPPSYARYASIAARAEALKNFAVAENTIVVRDSLLQYKDMDEATLLELASTFAAQKAKALEEEQRRLEEKQAQQAKGGLLQNLTRGGRSNGDPMGNWYFYNATALQQGQLEFRRVWGNRQLQDNWRRAQAAGMLSAGNTNISDKPAESAEEEQEQAGFDTEGFIAEFLALVPRDPAMQDTYLDEIEKAMFEKARVLRYELDNLPLALKAYEEFTTRFPQSALLPDALYSMMLMAEEQGNESRAEELKSSILEKYPASIFAMALMNPGYLGDTEGILTRVQEVYGNAYRLYKTGLYLESRSILQGAFLEFPVTEFSDRLRYLELMNISKIDNEWVFREALASFLDDFPDSDLVEQAQTAESIYSIRREEIFDAVRDGYRKGEEGPFYVIMHFEKGNVNQDFWVEQFINKMAALSLPVMVRDAYTPLNDQESLLLFSGFNSWDQVMLMVQGMKEDSTLKSLVSTENLPIFGIDNVNFERLYRNKDVKEYLAFFADTYLKQ